MKTFNDCPFPAWREARAALTALGLLFSFAAPVLAAPQHSWIGANSSCSLVSDNGVVVTTNGLSSAKVFYDASSSWYTIEGQVVALSDATCSFSAAKTGYTTVWKSYETAPTKYSDESPKNATKTIASDSTVDLYSYVDKKTLINTLLVGPSGRTLLYAVLTPVTYNLQYDLDGGSWPAKFTPPSTATYDVSFTLKNPSKTGHTFTGWDADGTSYPYGSGTSMTFKNLATVAGTNVAFTAQWERESYDLMLTFADGVSEIRYRIQDETDEWSAWQSVAKTSTVRVPYGLRWEAYCETAQHWTYSGSGSSEDNPTSGTMGTSGAKFAPVPSRQTYKVTLTANPPTGGTCGTSEGGYTYPSESDAHLWATPQTGYHFTNWSDGSVENPHTITMLCATNVWVNFEKNVYTVTFSYRNENGSLTTEEQSVAYGESATEPGSAKRNVNTGYVFENWDNSTWKTVAGNLNVNADYAANSYTVKFVGNGGVTKNDMTSYTQSFNYGEEKNLTANTFSRTGYIFTGWSTTVDATSPSRHYSNEELVKNIVSASDGTPFDTGATLVLYAQWTPTTYKIHFEANGGTGTMDDITVSYDEAVELPACEFTGAQPFVSWTCSADGNDYADCETVVRLASEDGAVVTMSANWGEAGCVVTFDANGGEGKMDSQSFTADVEFPLFPNTFTKEGYAFAGWSFTAADVPSASILPDQSLVTTNSGFTLFAVWEPNACQVTFDANNGTGARIVTNFTYDVDLTPQTALGFTVPAGLETFVGWGTNTATALYKADEPKKNLTPVNGDHVKLHAIWGLKACGQYSKALGCENLVWQTDQPAWWGASDAGLVFKREKDYNPLYVYFKSGPVRGTYMLSYEWMPSNTASKLEIRWKGKTELIMSSTNPCEWVKDRIRIEATGYEQKIKLEIEPTDTCELRNVRWTRVATDTKNVTFDLAGGTRMRSVDRVYGGETNQVVETGRVALEPTVAPPAGQVLAKWKVGDVDVSVDGVADRPVENDTTFTADYEDVVYKVIYANAKGDEGFENPNPTAFKASEIRTIGELKNAGGESRATGFLGWKVGRGENVVPTVTIPKGTTSNFVVTAVWDGQTVVETNMVSFVTVADGIAVTNTVVVESGKNVKTPTPAARPGYAFVGWDKSADAVTSDRTLTAQYEKISYPISYRNTRGLVNGNTTYKNLPQSYTVDDEITLDRLLPDAGDADSKFLGWSADGGETLTNGIAKGTTGEKIFTAVWSNTVYTITYVGLEGATHSNPTTYTCEDKIVFSEPSARAGYAFAGWTPEMIVKGSHGDLTVKANWTTLPPGPEPEPEGISAILVDGYDILNGDAGMTRTAPVGVFVQWFVDVTSSSDVTLRVSGLPSGLKFTATELFDRTASVTVPANTIYGTPKTAGRTNTIKVYATADGTTKTGTMQIAVEALPTWLVAPFNGGATAAESGGEISDAGSAYLSVMKTGRITGKWISGGLTWSLKSTCFSDYSAEDATYEANLIAKSGRLQETVSVSFASAAVDETFVGTAESDFFRARGTNWRVEPWKSVAKTLKGARFVYEIEDLSGTGSGATLTGRVGSSGVVVVKGVFGSYRASVRGTLEPLGDDRFELFLYYPLRKNRFDGYATRLTLVWDGEELTVE